MCRLAVGFKSGQNDTFNRILKNQGAKLRSQKDGIGALLYDGEEVTVDRRLKDYDKTFDKVEEKIDESKLVSIHTRFRTAGDVSLQNVHFFEHNGWVFAHNGHVTDYTGRWTSGRSHRHSSGRAGFKSNKKKKQTQINVDWEDHQKDTWEKYDNNEYQNPMEELNNLWATIDDCYACGYDTHDVCSKHASIKNRIIKLESQEFIDDNIIETVAEKRLEAVVEDMFQPGAEGGGALVKEEDVANVYSYEEHKEESRACDTLKFLQNLEYPITKENLEEAVEEKGFVGMGFLFNKETKQAFLIVEKLAYIVTDEKKFALFFSFNPSKANQMASMLGVPYLIEPQELMKGVYPINLK